jgi:hypothetical protein
MYKAVTISERVGNYIKVFCAGSRSTKITLGVDFMLSPVMLFFKIFGVAELCRQSRSRYPTTGRLTNSHFLWCDN